MSPMRFGVTKRVSIALPLVAIAIALAYSRLHSEDTLSRPSVVLILADDVSWFTTGAAGGVAQTPELDALASQGIHFNHALATSPFCKPARMTLHTGLYPSEHGVVSNRTRLHEPTAEVFLFQELRGADYVTAHFGKWHMPGFDPDESGFETWNIEPAAAVQNALAFLDDVADGRLGSGESPARFALSLSLPYAHSPWNASPAALRAVRDHPYPLRANVNRPGVPSSYYDYLRAEQRRRLSRRGFDPDGDPKALLDAYHASISEMSRQVAKILRRLDLHGFTADTIVVFTSDQGLPAGGHGLWLKGAYGHYEEYLRVPLFIRYPAKVEGGRISSATIATVDLAPTILGLAGLPVPDRFSGTNAAPHMIDRKSWPLRSALHQSHRDPPFSGHARAIRTSEDHPLGSWTLALHPPGDPGSNTAELYDNSNDPFQLVNVALDPDFATVFDQLESELLQWMEERGDPAADQWR